MRTLRRQIAGAMVRVHRITPELARYHVSQMDEAELLFRVRMYAGTELSAVGPKSERSTSSTQFDARNDSSRPTALNCVPAKGEGAALPFVMLRSEKETGSEGRGAFRPGSCLDREKKLGKPGAEIRSWREGL